MPLPANDSQTDNGNGKVTLALVCQEVRHLGERQVEQHALTQSMIREVTDRLDRQHADHENRLRTVEKCTSQTEGAVSDLVKHVGTLEGRQKIGDGATVIATALAAVAAFFGVAPK